MIDLLLMSANPTLIDALCKPDEQPNRRVSAIVVDLESDGKADRQQLAPYLLGTDTSISADTFEDLANARDRVPNSAKLICRTNTTPIALKYDIEMALEAGVDELLIPMVRTACELEQVFEMVNGRARVGIMVETVDAVNCISDLSTLPLSRVYVGLMDLAIERKSSSPFEAMVDGTVEKLREHINAPFGLAGLTIPSHGFPIPSHVLMAELVRIGCDFTVLRRSFISDTQHLPECGKVDAIESIYVALGQHFASTDAERCRVHSDFVRLVSDSVATRAIAVHG